MVQRGFTLNKKAPGFPGAWRSSWAVSTSTLRSCSLLLYDLVSVITLNDLRFIFMMISVNEAIGAMLLQVGATNMIKVATVRNANTASKFAVMSALLVTYLEAFMTVSPPPRGHRA